MNKTNYLVKIGVLSAIAFVLQFMGGLLPKVSGFLEIEISDFPAVIGALSLGPVAGFLIELIKNVIHLTVSTTGYVGEFANLIVNVAFAFVKFKRDCVLAIGLLLFLLCDFFVGMSMIGGYLPIEEGTFIYHLAHPSFNAAWLFYVPSQALLASSIFFRRLRKQ